MRRFKHILYKSMGSEGILFSLDTYHPYVINGVGAEVLKLMDRGMDENSIAEKVSKKYGINKERIKRDFSYFYEELIEKGVIFIHEKNGFYSCQS